MIWRSFMGKWSGRNTPERCNCPLNQFGNSYEHFENTLPGSAAAESPSSRFVGQAHRLPITITATGAVTLQLFLPDQSLFQLWVRRILPDPDANQLMTECFVAHLPCFLP